jgi:hypothetical protein
MSYEQAKKWPFLLGNKCEMRFTEGMSYVIDGQNVGEEKLVRVHHATSATSSVTS